jgi:TatD DNase family protein
MEIVVKMGFYIGFGGAVTFKNAHNAVESVRHIPEERLLIETDCPYLAPVPHRGERNNSGYLKLVINKIAEIRETTPEHIEEVTWNNAKTLFRV